MTHLEALHVHLELAGATVFVGHAQFQRRRGALASTTFQYDPGYLAHPDAYPIDPAFELFSGTQHTRGLPGAFADSAPDRWGRNLITKRERALAREEGRRPHDLDDVDFLAGVSDITRQGALRFRVDDNSAFLDPGHTVPRLVGLPGLLHAADVAARATDGDDFEAVKALLDAGTGSLGGARPKAAVLGDDGRQLIAKFPHHEDDWDVMAWEATALDLAAAAGVRTPVHRLVQIDERHLLLLDRFDRVDRTDGADPDRVGYISAMTLLERRDGETGDYMDIAERLEEVSAQTKEDANQLFRRVAVSVGLNNTDDHLRNHGFLRGRAGWTLSPAFDVNANPDSDARQTTIAGAETFSDEADGLLELARACRLPPNKARTVLTQVGEALADWREVATRNHVPTSELARFEHSFKTGLATLADAAARSATVITSA
ncbi:type II toxin-antitoxin system HipA family toxin [Leifsonia sp. McL0607]|uniref:type II toxin-antitoxin system HipA family toxin n=1 Tax=Leifsonia sp. McL0607 TaxID=3415672 RepID=UPI003CF87CAA